MAAGDVAGKAAVVEAVSGEEDDSRSRWGWMCTQFEEAAGGAIGACLDCTVVCSDS